MRVLFALAFVAVVSAVPELKSIELPAPTKPEVQPTEKQESVVAEPTQTLVKQVDAPETVKIPSLTIVQNTPEFVKPTLAAQEEIIPIKIVDTPTEQVAAGKEIIQVVDFPIKQASAPAKDSDVTVKVVDTPTQPIPVVDAPAPIDIGYQTFQLPAPETPISAVYIEELAHDDLEAMRRLIPDPMSLIDIGTLFVPEEVLRQVERMADQDTDAVNVGGAHPFSFNNAEPLDHFEHVVVVDSPVNELDAMMDPVIVVESASGEQAPFAAMPNVPETVKVVNIGDFQDIPLDMMRPVPMENWRGPPPMLQAPYRPRPVYYRDMEMARGGPQYN